MNVKKELEREFGVRKEFYFNDIEVDPNMIKAIMINEIVPQDLTQDFYGQSDADYMKTTIPLFQKAGIQVSCIKDILDMGIYITNAVKVPKSQTTVDKTSIEESLIYLEKEINLFPNVKVVMLMGDVARKAFNMITKKVTSKNVVPSISTYKLRSSEIYYGDIRVMPSYIMTGKNILIEKSKVEMVAEDIAIMVKLIK